MELIRIMTTGEQGSPVVSARELYDFLGFDASQWSRWLKKNILTNPYGKEGEDWQPLDIMSKTSEGGRPSVDFALSLDFAKRLSMLARTGKGEEIRKYFLSCEQRLQTTVSSTSLLNDHEKRIATLERQIAALQMTALSESSTEQSFVAELPFPSAPTSCLRTKVYRLVNQYATATKTAHYMVWNDVYSKLLFLYGFNVRAHRKRVGETWIDVAERHGQMDRIFAIVSAELNYSEE